MPPPFACAIDGSVGAANCPPATRKRSECRCGCSSPAPRPAVSAALEAADELERDAKAPAEEAALPESRFTFYDSLPAFELVIPETESDVSRNAPAKPVARPGAYVLQVGSF